MNKIIITCFLCVESDRVLFKLFVLVQERTGSVVILTHVGKSRICFCHVLPFTLIGNFDYKFDYQAYLFYAMM